MNFGQVNASHSLPEWQAVKLTFSAPWKTRLSNDFLFSFKFVFTRKVLHVGSFWKWECLEPGNSLFQQGPQGFQFSWGKSLPERISFLRNLFLTRAWNKIAVLSFINKVSIYARIVRDLYGKPRTPPRRDLNPGSLIKILFALRDERRNRGKRKVDRGRRLTQEGAKIN